MPADLKDLAEIASELLDRTLAFIPRVDARAQVLLSLNLAALVVLALNVPPPAALQWPMLVGLLSVGAFAVSLWRIYDCLFPQLSGGTNSLLYFRQIATLPETDFITQTIARDFSTYVQDLLSQVWRNAQIASVKFDALKKAMLAFAIGIPLWLITLAFFVSQTTKLALR
jgi:hypothetical protein